MTEQSQVATEIGPELEAGELGVPGQVHLEPGFPEEEVVIRRAVVDRSSPRGELHKTVEGKVGGRRRRRQKEHRGQE